MAEFQQKYAGCWCLIPNGKKPKEEIYTAYQQRNTSYEGKMFVLFIALVILTRLKMKLMEKRKGNKVSGRLKTYVQLLFRMSTLAKVSYEGTYKPIYSTPSKLQGEIIRAFGLNWPGSP
jgi:hypothetical protein